MVTIYDIAKALNITPSTVSRALNDNSRISAKTREAVQEMAAQMGYQPNSVAAALRSGRTFILGVVVPTADRSFFSSVVRGIEGVASTAGYNVMVTQSNDNARAEASNIDALLKAQVDGIMISVARETSSFEHFKKVKERGIPLVLFDRVTDQLKVGKVVVDDYLGAYQATEHLIQQGCIHIAHFAGPEHLNIYKDRKRGYREALENNGLPFDESLVLHSTLQLEDGRMGMTELLNRKQRPDALFSASDYPAVGAMQVLKEQGLRIPDDLALVGFSNEPFTAFIEPSLSTVNQHSEEMGAQASRMILEQIQSSDPDFLPRKITLSPTLIVRASSVKNKVT